MPKRFTATEKWDDPWFCSLTIKNQMFWIYLLDKCNHAGIWQVNWPLVEFHIKGYQYDPLAFQGRILELNAQKWFIPKFVTFQYGELNASNRAHASVISVLEKEGASKELASPMLAHKDKDKEQDKDKGVRDGMEGSSVPPPGAFEMLWERYPRKEGGRAIAQERFKVQVKTMLDFLDIQKALDNFLAQLREDGTERKYIPHGSTWFNKRWRDYVNWTIVKAQGKLESGAVAPIPGKYDQMEEITRLRDLAKKERAQA